MKKNKIVVIVGIVMLLSICWSLLCFSGAVPTFTSPIVYERLNYLNLQALSKTVKLINQSASDVHWSAEILEEHAPDIEKLIYELPERRPYSIYDTPITDLDIIISGHRRDKLGMIWAITDSGNVVKIHEGTIGKTDN